MDEFIYKLKKLFGERIVDDSFIINLKQYNAVKDKSAWS
jgi:hypothetical protein